MTPLIDAILGHARGTERFVHYRDRMVINDSTLTLQVLERSAQASGMPRLTNQAGNREQAMTGTSEFLQTLTRAFTYLGLSEDQEAVLTRLAEEAYARLGELMEGGRLINDRRSAVSRRLDQLATL